MPVVVRMRSLLTLVNGKLPMSLFPVQAALQPLPTLSLNMHTKLCEIFGTSCITS